MPWEGYTHFRVIDVGTSIRFVESRAVLGVPPAPIQVGAQKRIVLGGAAPAIVVTIIATGENELQIRTPDGIVWQMTHHTRRISQSSSRRTSIFRIGWFVASLNNSILEPGG
jgi:hypothetical protein